MNTTLRYGDFLYRTKNFILHVGIYLGNNRVLHNLPGRGIHISSLEEFADGKQMTFRAYNLPPSDYHKERLIELLNSESEYDALKNNCEHTAWYFATGESKSPQVTSTSAGIVVGATLGGLLFGKKGAVFGALALGGMGLLVSTSKESHQQLRIS